MEGSFASWHRHHANRRGNELRKGDTHVCQSLEDYSGQGGSALFDALAKSEDDVKALISTVPGFTSYAAFRNDSGGQTVTVCQDKAGTDESSRRAAE